MGTQKQRRVILNPVDDNDDLILQARAAKYVLKSGRPSGDVAIISCFMFLTGARISEALAVTWDDVDFPNRRALIRQTKVGSERWAHLPAVLVAAIANITDRKESVFKYVHRESAKDSWRKAIRRAGIKPLTYHCLRHGFATAMLRAGVDPVTVAKHGGWASPAHVFATYGHAKDDPTLTDLIAPDVTTRRKSHVSN